MRIFDHRDRMEDWYKVCTLEQQVFILFYIVLHSILVEILHCLIPFIVIL